MKTIHNTQHRHSCTHVCGCCVHVILKILVFKNNNTTKNQWLYPSCHIRIRICMLLVSLPSLTWLLSDCWCEWISCVSKFDSIPSGIPRSGATGGGVSGLYPHLKVGCFAPPLGLPNGLSMASWKRVDQH